MKKNITKLTATLLTLVFMFSGVFSLMVSADNTERPTCLKDHFSNLRNNINGNGEDLVPPNEIGTCTHVAMSMLLSFYDFYWNDRFVPAIYNAEDDTYHQMGWENATYDSSTDTLIETFNASPENAAWESHENNDFMDFAECNTVYYLQPYLMNIAENETLTGSVGIVGMVGFQVVRVLEDYLSSVGLGPEQGVEVHIEYGFPTATNMNASRDTLFNTIKGKINEGHPVMFLGLDYIDVLPEFIDEDTWEISAHAMVAYDVVNRNGTEDIQLHKGWNGTETEYYYTTVYNKVNSAIWIEIDESKLPHVCTQKYYDEDLEQSFCACYVYSNTHPAHTTPHNYQYSSIDEHYHQYACGCGDLVNTELHSFTYSQYSSVQHNKVCTVCGYTDLGVHSFSIQRYTTQYHKEACGSCGYYELKSHSERRYVDKDESYHYIYCDCGEIMGMESHNIVSTGIRNTYCVDCKRTFSTPGGGGIAIIKGIPDTPGVNEEQSNY